MAGARPVKPKKFRSRKHMLPAVAFALDQIEAKDYCRRYFASGRRVVAVGLNLAADSAEESSRIEYQARVRGLSDPD